VANFGVSPNRNNDYLISRTDWYADLRIADQVQVFTQFESDYAPWKTMLTPADQDILDLEQGVCNSDRACRRRHGKGASRSTADEFRLSTVCFRP
jgi:hypothetical protein